MIHKSCKLWLSHNITNHAICDHHTTSQIMQLAWSHDLWPTNHAVCVTTQFEFLTMEPEVFHQPSLMAHAHPEWRSPPTMVKLLPAITAREACAIDLVSTLEHKQPTNRWQSQDQILCTTGSHQISLQNPVNAHTRFFKCCQNHVLLQVFLWSRVK